MLAPTVSSAGSTAAASSTKQNDIGQKDIFLKLLVAQMENQDPLKPQDATQMSSQLAQFNMVEQQTAGNKLLEQLVAAQGGGSSSNQPTTGASYLGHSVTVNQSEINYDGTNQTFSAVLDGPAVNAIAYIFNAAGEPVKTISMTNLGAGANQIVWDGTIDSGAQAPQGSYVAEFNAVNVNGGTVPASIQRSGVVDAVRFTSNGTELMVGGVAASLNNVTEIRL